MTLKVRLAAMMVLILVAVLALQYLLMEKERQGLLTRLEELSTNMDRTTAVFVERVRDASTGSHDREIDALLAELSTLPDLQPRGGATLKLLTWADTTGKSPEHLFEESHLEMRVEFAHENDDSASLLFSDLRAFDPEGMTRLWRKDVEEVRRLSLHPESLLVVAELGGTTMVVRRFADFGGGGSSDTLIGEDARHAFGYVGRSVLADSGGVARVDGWNSEMVINLPVGGGPADSFYSVQVRYPLDSLTEELARSRRSGFLWLGAVLGVGIIGAVLVAGQFTRPIRSLQASFGRVESGDLDVNVTPERPDEIGQLTTSFNDMVERLRDSKEVEARLTEAERLASIGRLAAGVAHEVRNPLNTILLSMQQMRDKLHARIDQGALDPSSPNSEVGGEDFERYYRIVTGEIARLESMVTAFLDLSKSEELRFVQTDVATQLTHAVELFRPEAESRGILIERSGDPSLPIFGDENRLPMVWNNLLANALAATPPNSLVRVEARIEAGGVFVTFADQGSGVPLGLRDRIWDPFFSGKDSGTGLGLSIVRSVVERHGGTVTLANVPSAEFPGACFEVFLPKSQEVD